MRKTISRATVAALATVAGLALPCAAMAQSTPWLVRLRAVNLDSDNKVSTGLNLSVNNKVYPSLDISYFFTPDVALELALTTPEKHDIRSSGARIGELKQMQSNLSLQYHFTQLDAFKPYVGVGMNYTRFSGVSFDSATEAALQPRLDSGDWGASVQLGFDYVITKNTYLNFDVKKVQMRTDVKSFGTKVGEFKVDPWLVGLGVGWRF